MNKKHGMVGTPEYRAWTNMKSRCSWSKRIQYKEHYQDRGIKVCDEWLHSFTAFYEHVGPRPSNKHSLDRIDNDGNYEPGNCRWATRSEQLSNTRRNRMITYNGRTQILARWAEELGIRVEALRARLDRYGWSLEKAMTPGDTRYKK